MNLFQTYNKLYVYLKQNVIEFSKDGFPVFKENMFTDEIPKEILPFNRRNECKNKKKTALCTCQVDKEIYPRIEHLDQDLEEWKSFMACIVFDLSPRLEWRSEIQKFNICLNQMSAIYLALHGVKLIGNLRVGSLNTIGALYSYPTETCFLVGSLGCTKYLSIEDLDYFSTKILITLPKRLYFYGSLEKHVEKLIKGYGIPYKVFPPRREISFAKYREALGKNV